MYESVLSAVEDSVVYAEISGFVEKKFRLSADYLFVVEVMWTDHRTTYIKRSYNDFCKFHRRLTNHFIEKYEKGILKTPIFIPKINGPWLFQRATRDLAEKREEELHSFLQQLLQGNPLIACNHIVVEFFQSRSTDPVSSMNTLNGIAKVEKKDDITCNNDSEDDDRDEILFMR